MFATMKPYAPPPPPGAQPPPLWGRADHVRALLGDRVTDLEARQQTLRVTEFADGAAFRDYFKANYGPTIAVYTSLADEPERTAALDAELAALGDRFHGTARWSGSTCSSPHVARSRVVCLESAPHRVVRHTTFRLADQARQTGLMGSTVDLVADIGESFGSWTMGDDALILRTLTSANIACGFHAGDPRTMKRSVELCLENDVSIGAHPSFPDLVGFGRRAMELSREEIATDVIYQVGALQAFARAAGTEVRHVSPHGRLGTLVATDPHYAQGVADGIEQLDATLTVLTMTGELEREARARGLRVVVFGLVDRNLEDDGTLVSRRDPEALVHDEDALVERALSMVLDGSVLSRHGTRIEVTCDSLLMHGDHPSSVRTAERIRAALEEAGVEIAAFAGTRP